MGRKVMSDHSSDEVGAAITARRWHSRATLAKPARPHPYARVRSSVERNFAHTHVAHSPVSSIPPLPGSSLVSSAQSPPALTARTVCHAPRCGRVTNMARTTSALPHVLSNPCVYLFGLGFWILHTVTAPAAKSGEGGVLDSISHSGSGSRRRAVLDGWPIARDGWCSFPLRWKVAVPPHFLA